MSTLIKECLGKAYDKSYIHKEHADSWKHKISVIIKYCESQNNRALSVDDHNACCLLYDYAELYAEIINIKGGLYKDQSRILNALYNRVKQLAIKDGTNIE